MPSMRERIIILLSVSAVQRMPNSEFVKAQVGLWEARAGSTGLQQGLQRPQLMGRISFQTLLLWVQKDLPCQLCPLPAHHTNNYAMLSRLPNHVFDHLPFINQPEAIGCQLQTDITLSAMTA